MSQLPNFNPSPGLFQFQLEAPGVFSQPDTEIGRHQAATGSTSGVPGKAAKWEPWEDRALARQVLADDPINCIRGRTPEKWLDVSVHLSEIRPKPIRRTADSCRARMKKLVLLHKSDQSRSLQKTGANEEVNQFIQDTDELLIRWDQGSIDPSVRQVAEEQSRRLEGEGQVVRDASLRGLRRKRDETIEQSGGEASEEELDEQSRPTKKRKNDTARRINMVLDDLAREEDSDNAALMELRCYGPTRRIRERVRGFSVRER
ncbi:hypothetical protein DFP73DRAFT_598662 [Morchella snyderi]|nr:hypothetical protein DFP73DRAFT_598662 [Morchella snyderi]